MGTHLTLEIQDIGHRGVGIGRHQGKVVMVPFTAPGDTAEVEVVRSHSSYDQARLVRLVEPSPLRTSPPCPYFGLCGGCHLQHLDGARQRAIKARLFREALTRHAGVEETRVGPIIAAPEDLGYRSKIEMHRGPGLPLALGFM
ncbi:MAG: class I SAM-dependent RNA methyltransferase [Thermodesulfobacteriota bacterium]